MRKIWAVLAAAALTAAAFFLPAALSQWGDQWLLDEPHITRQEEEREGFAESLQLSVAEKLLLLRSGGVASVALEEDYEETESVTIVASNENMELKFRETEGGGGQNVSHEAEENAEKWSGRMTRAQNELRGLQAMGAMPYLWDSEDTVVCTGHSQTLYIDRESQVSFLAYSMTLTCSPYTLNIMADAKSGRFLAFRLSWSKGAAPDWGFRGAARFGPAWRDYWGMDSVNSVWNSEYIRSILEVPPEEFVRSGSYNSNADVSFRYDTQTLRAPLVSWVHSNMDGSLEWNLF